MNLPALSITVPRVPVGDGFKAGVDFLKDNLAWLFDIIGTIIEVCVEFLGVTLSEPSATQLFVAASVVVAVGLWLRGHRYSATIPFAVWIAVWAAEAYGGATTAMLSQLDPVLFTWAQSLFGEEARFVYPQLLPAIPLFLALAVLSFTMTRDPRQRRLAIYVICGLAAFIALHFIVGVQLSLLVTMLFVLVAWLIAGTGLAIFSLLGFLLIISMGLFDDAMSTLALIIVATAVAVAIALPLGVLAAYNDRVSNVLKPVLDFMQTLPAFVYLLPAISFFSVGEVPGVIATVIFAMPPGVRLTELGIRQVDKELVEAGEAFGAPDSQILRNIQLPLALSTIMAGINQVIMLSLSMVVIAGMVGASGLGNQVYTGIAQAQIPIGFEGGIGVVILAIYLDRLTGAVTRFSPAAKAQRAAASR
ncbi:glycine betaine/proline transport system permease protein [Murinocardiopsis flavida]|uniref:Glycine betaine/proline transport system permease protein n=1 Tax=Murinocardiopsis flavida TaxID=645275 RepID=A0A2P8DGA9_9ACTN|nr:ABC transporter permease subunit [Murinocardiopsis flavida]PSK96250.1 glycine betaine/proline transport system permease protein [Murinocardiopsis flavida]